MARGRGRTYSARSNRNFKRDARGRFARTGAAAKGFVKRHKRAIIVGASIAGAGAAAYGGHKYFYGGGKDSAGKHTLFIRHKTMVYKRVPGSGGASLSKQYHPYYSLKNRRKVTHSHPTEFRAKSAVMPGQPGWRRARNQMRGTQTKLRRNSSTRVVKPAQMWRGRSGGNKIPNISVKTSQKWQSDYVSWMKTQPPHKRTSKQWTGWQGVVNRRWTSHVYKRSARAYYKSQKKQVRHAAWTLAIATAKSKSKR